MKPSNGPSTASTASWLLRPAPNPAAAIRLFCLPYAGGSAYLFRDWTGLLPASAELVAVQLPGRGGHMHAPPLTNVTPLTEALVEALIPVLDKPFAIFGHSMGAILGFEAARRLRALGLRTPVHLFVSGRRAPQIADHSPRTFDRPDAEFVADLGRMNGTPPAVLENDELMTLMMPVLRADFAVCQTYAYQPGPPLDCPITAFSGMSDEEETCSRMAAWREQTTAAFDLRQFAGDHFFVKAAAPQIVDVVSQRLQDTAPWSGWSGAAP